METTSDLLKKPWTPFQMCLPDRRDPKSEIYLNSRYQVHLQRHPSEKEGMPDLVHLSYKRRDQYILVPYQDKLRIKDELVHPECEGVELLPARSREVDLANQYHLWIVDSVHFRFPLDTRMLYQIADPPPSSVGESDLLKKLWTPFLPGDKFDGCIVYRNSRYQVYLQRFSSQGSRPDAVYLFLQRLDQRSSSLIPYRDKMRVKDELIHPEAEGIELFPARSRALPLMPGCALWVIDDPTYRFPFGFSQRVVSDIALDGAVQEPWPTGERPPDCLSEAELRKLMSGENENG
jgi:hypothetical protein